MPSDKWELNPGFPRGWQTPDYLSPECLPPTSHTVAGGWVGSRAELESQHSEMDRWHPKQGLNSCTNCLPMLIFWVAHWTLYCIVFRSWINSLTYKEILIVYVSRFWVIFNIWSPRVISRQNCHSPGNRRCVPLVSLRAVIILVTLTLRTCNIRVLRHESRARPRWD